MGAIRVYIVLKHHIQDIGFVRVQYIQNYYKRLRRSKTMTNSKLEDMRSLIASAQSINIEGPDKERIQKLYWALEDALTHVKILLDEVLKDE